MKEIIKYIKTYVILIIIFVLSLTITSIIPQEYLKKNTQKSADYFMSIGRNQDIYLPFKYIKLFLYTDALMVNTAYSIDNTTPFYSAMVARKNYIKGITKKVYPESQYDLNSVSKYNEKTKTASGDIRNRADQTAELYDTAYDNIDESIEYTRYWHGYLVYLRPLLLLFDYATIRIISTFAFCLLLIIFIYIMSNKTSFFQAISFVIGFILVGGFFIATSINSIICFYIAFIASIYILLRYEKIKNINLIFFIIGMITNFIDFFTNPILTIRNTNVSIFCNIAKERRIRL